MWIALAIDLVIFIPLGLLKKTKIVSASGLYISSLVFGATLFFFSLLTTYFSGGIFWLLVGIFFLGIGVIPIALFFTLIKGMWLSLGTIILLAMFAFGASILGSFLSESSNKLAEEDNIY